VATVQTLIDHAVHIIDDTSNVSSYYTAGYLSDASGIVAELVNHGIGVVVKRHTTTIDDTFTPAYTPTDATKIPIPLPAGVSNESQIVGIEYDYFGYSEDLYFPMEDNESLYYILVPSDYEGDITIKYRPSCSFTATTDVLPISDDAVSAVAALGLAWKLSKSELPGKTTEFKNDYELAKKAWRRSNAYSQRSIRDVYSDSWEW